MAKARKITRTRLVVSPGFAELVVWEVPEPLSGSLHSYKYRLVYVVNGVCRVRYDNERGKGDIAIWMARKVLIRFAGWSGCWRIFGAT